MNMEKQDSMLNTRESVVCVIGLVVFVIAILMTIIFANSFSPLELLQIRLLIVGLGIIYYLTIYFFHHKRCNKITKNTLETNTREIIILFNGKELGRS